MKRASDMPDRLLAFAVRIMPSRRSEWGAAMLAELAQLRDSRARWGFALGCTWAAVFVPQTGGFPQTMKTNMITAMLASTALVAPLMFLQLRFGYSAFPYPLFAILWLVPAAFVLAAAPLVRAVRAGQSVLARPGVLMARAAFLLLAALFWILIVSDQMPCFLGVPNCD